METARPESTPSDFKLMHYRVISVHSLWVSLWKQSENIDSTTVV